MLILKQLRRKKNISQTDLAKAVGVSLRTIQLYEKKNANIPIKNLNKIADYFDMGIDKLYAHEVNESDVLYTKEKIDIVKGHTIQKLAPGKYLISAPIIMEKWQRGYLKNLDNRYFLNDLPRTSFVVDRVSTGNYLSFEISNNSMDNSQVNGIPKRSIVLGKRVRQKDVLKQIKEENSYWILVCTNAIMCKEITHYDKKSNSITCHSLNSSPEYPDFKVPISEVLNFYKLIRKQVD